MLHYIFDIIIIFSILWLLSKQASIIIWTITYMILGALWMKYYNHSYIITDLFFFGVLFCLILSYKPLRGWLISRHILNFMAIIVPNISDTEKTALEAGTTSWEKELFTGKPDYNQLLATLTAKISTEEQQFIDHTVTTLCRMINDWEITHNLTDLPEPLWGFIKTNKFFGMIIPKEYDGLEFSVAAQAMIFAKIYSCSISVATTISVPNSLGPAELLLKYGTKEQKDYYLPRLAIGMDIPCFALTSPTAGSDAASIIDQGIICYNEINGKKVLGMNLTWNKRYITLCPIATIIGLAFRLYDPDNILNRGYDIGISCALIPANTPGVIKGRRHFPLNTAFLNGPTQGTDVFVPINCLIGGVAMAGMGWQMLMECLSVGRAIALPSGAMGGSQAAALASGAYAHLRQQFHQPIAKFEGIIAPLARIAGYTYIIESAVQMAILMISHGDKPALASAIIKYHTTEYARKIILDAMDIHGGKGICLGPNNYLGRGYQNMPISITVEGANILTRNLIIFGQGLMRGHPYLYTELASIKTQNIEQFDTAFWEHVGFGLANFVKTLTYNITNGYGLSVPYNNLKSTPNLLTLNRYYQQIQQYSTYFAFITDCTMLLLGNKLKKSERLSARLGDILSYLYLAMAVLKHFHDTCQLEEDLPLVHWCCQELLWQCSQALQDFIANIPYRWARICLRIIIRPLGFNMNKPLDTLDITLAKILTTTNNSRNRLTKVVFKENLANCPLGRLESAFIANYATNDIINKLRQASIKYNLQNLSLMEQINQAVTLNCLTLDEAEQLHTADTAKNNILAVDDFADSDLRR